MNFEIIQKLVMSLVQRMAKNYGRGYTNRFKSRLSRRNKGFGSILGPLLLETDQVQAIRKTVYRKLEEIQ